jgi:hypothetical protein
MRARGLVGALIVLALPTFVASPGQAAEPWPADTGEQGSTVTVTVVADQYATAGTAIRPFRVIAQDSDPSRILMYTATGLPDGLSISTVIGSISGIPTTAGQSKATVTVTDGNGAKGTVTFGWTVAAGSSPLKPIDGSAYTINLIGTTKVIGNPRASLVAGPPTVVDRRPSGPNLSWTAVTNPDGGYSFRNGASQMCLDVTDASTSIGSALAQSECTDAAHQQWNLIESGAGFSMVNAESGLMVGCAREPQCTRLSLQPSGLAWEFSRP